jgi:hypothetical protein
VVLLVTATNASRAQSANRSQSAAQPPTAQSGAAAAATADTSPLNTEYRGLRARLEVIEDSLGVVSKAIADSELVQRALGTEGLNEQQKAAAQIRAVALSSLTAISGRLSSARSEINDRITANRVAYVQRLTELLRGAKTDDSVRLQKAQNEAEQRIAEQRALQFRDFRTIAIEWRKDAALLSSVTATAASIALISAEESDLLKASPWLQLAGVAASLYGAGLTREKPSNSDEYVAGGLAFTALVRMWTNRDGKIRQIAERVARNVAFSAEIHHADSLAARYQAQSEALAASLDSLTGARTTPTHAQVTRFEDMIATQDQLFNTLDQLSQIANRIMRDDQQSKESRIVLTELIRRYGEAQRTWRSHRAFYVDLHRGVYDAVHATPSVSSPSVAARASS